MFWTVQQYQLKVYSTFIPTSLQNSSVYCSDFLTRLLLYMFWALKLDLDGRKQDYGKPKNSCLSFEVNPTQRQFFQGSDNQKPDATIRVENNSLKSSFKGLKNFSWSVNRWDRTSRYRQTWVRLSECVKNNAISWKNRTNWILMQMTNILIFQFIPNRQFSSGQTRAPMEKQSLSLSGILSLIIELCQYSTSFFWKTWTTLFLMQSS